MKIVTDLARFDKKKFPKLVIALGNFDGVHRGHLEMIRMIREEAKKLGAFAAVFTFREHPQRILHRKENPPILTSLVHKLLLLQQAGLDLCILIDFTEALSQKEPDEFIRDIFVDRLGAKVVCMGFNARFGRNRSGDIKKMDELSHQYGFSFLQAPAFQVSGETVSSSMIRSLVKEGRLEQAAVLLGRPYSFFGTVVPGSGRGREIGFPTANLDPHSEVMPPEGVYAVWVRSLLCELVPNEGGFTELQVSKGSASYQGVLNYGRRPTFESGENVVPEVHLLNFSDDLTGKTIEVTIGRRLRDERTFSSREALRCQIEIDIQESHQWLGEPHRIKEKRDAN